jgi:hypothetical protein
MRKQLSCRRVRRERRLNVEALEMRWLPSLTPFFTVPSLAPDPIGTAALIQQTPAPAVIMNAPAPPVATPVTQTLGSEVNQATALVTPVVQTVAVAADPVVAQVATITAVVQPVADVVQQTVAPVTSLTTPIAETVATLATPVTSLVSDVDAPVVRPVVDTLVVPLAPVVQTAAPVVQPIAPSIALVVEPVGDTVAAVVGPVGSASVPVIKPVGDVGAPVAAPVTALVTPIAVTVGTTSATTVQTVAGDVPPTIAPLLGPITEGVLPVAAAAGTTIVSTTEHVAAATGGATDLIVPPLAPQHSPPVWEPSDAGTLEAVAPPDLVNRLDRAAVNELVVVLMTGLVTDGSGGTDSASAPAAADRHGPAGGELMQQAQAGAQGEKAAEPDAQAIAVLADCGPFDTSALELAAAQFIGQLADLRQQLFGCFAGLGLYPWLGCAIAAAAVYRYQKQRRRARGEAAPEDDITAAWALGLATLPE